MGNFVGRLNRKRFVVLFINCIPLVRRNFPFIRKISVLIDNLRLNDIEDLFRVYITTIMTFALLTVHQVYTLLEIHYGINRIAIIYLIASCIKNQQFVKHLKDI